MQRISWRYRVALFGKGLLLAALAIVFGALLQHGTLDDGRWLFTRGASLVFFGVPFVFLVWTAALAFADALLGRAVQVDGAVALPLRRLSGISFRLPDGRSAEFILYNPGPSLVPNRRYAVTVGRWSRVLVAPPRELGDPPSS